MVSNKALAEYLCSISEVRTFHREFDDDMEELDIWFPEKETSVIFQRKGEEGWKPWSLDVMEFDDRYTAIVCTILVIMDIPL